jgi:hypothetical protein
MNAFFAKWINWWNGNPYCVSFMVHTWVTCVLVEHLGKVVNIYALAACLLALAAWKEFYWDHKNEPNHNAWPQGATDFGGYLFGATLAIVFTLTHT